MNKVYIDILGDPICDVWLNKNTIIAKPGGAANVYANIKELVKYNKNNIVVNFACSLSISDFDIDTAYYNKIPIKIYKNTNGSLENINTSDMFKSSCEEIEIKDLQKNYRDFNKQIDFNILVISNYSKGILTKYLDKYSLPFYNIIIIDSRYIFPKKYLELIKYKTNCLIIRESYPTDKSNINNYDYKISTAANEDIILKQNLFNTIPSSIKKGLKNKESKDSIYTIGAGDTATAALASWIAINKCMKTNFEVNFHTLIKSLEYIETCCELVTEIPFTAIPIFKIYNSLYYALDI